MIDIEITTDLEVPRWSFELTPDQWSRVGAATAESIQTRLRSGLGADGSPMPQLSPRYAQRKRRYGLPGIRDLRGLGRNGHMLDSLAVRPADSEVEITIEDPAQLEKAIANDSIAPWFGLSPQDQNAAGDAAFAALTGETGRAA